MRRKKRGLLAMAEEMALAMPFYQALEAGGGVPRYAVDMVRVGEMTGRLDDVLYGLYEYYAREHQLRQSVKSAVTYPLVMVAMMAVVVVVLMTKVLPVFEQVFALLGTQVSPFTAALFAHGAGYGPRFDGIFGDFGDLGGFWRVSALDHRRQSAVAGVARQLLWPEKIGAGYSDAQFHLSDVHVPGQRLGPGRIAGYGGAAGGVCAVSGACP